jgi:hypothetical protein
MEDVIETDPETVLALVPSCKDLFSIIRAAGPSNPAKAGAVSKALEPLRTALEQCAAEKKG